MVWRNYFVSAATITVPTSRRRAVALFVLLAAAAGAGVVAADLGAVAFHGRAGLVELAGVNPAAFLATEHRDLEMLLVLAVGAELGGKLDRAELVVGAALLGAGDGQAVPLGALGPLLGFLGGEILALVCAERALEVRDVMLHVRRIARTHQGLRRRGGRAGDDRAAALFVGLTGTTGTVAHGRVF